MMHKNRGQTTAHSTPRISRFPPRLDSISFEGFFASIDASFNEIVQKDIINKGKKRRGSYTPSNLSFRQFSRNTRYCINRYDSLQTDLPTSFLSDGQMFPHSPAIKRH